MLKRVLLQMFINTTRSPRLRQVRSMMVMCIVVKHSILFSRTNLRQTNSKVQAVDHFFANKGVNYREK